MIDRQQVEAKKKPVVSRVVRPGQGSNNSRFSQEIRRFGKWRCQKRCNGSRSGRTFYTMAHSARDYQIRDLGSGAASLFQGVDEPSVPKTIPQELFPCDFSRYAFHILHGFSSFAREWFEFGTNHRYSASVSDRGLAAMRRPLQNFL